MSFESRSAKRNANAYISARDKSSREQKYAETRLSFAVPTLETYLDYISAGLSIDEYIGHFSDQKVKKFCKQLIDHLNSGYQPKPDLAQNGSADMVLPNETIISYLEELANSGAISKPVDYSSFVTSDSELGAMNADYEAERAFATPSQFDNALGQIYSELAKGFDEDLRQHVSASLVEVTGDLSEIDTTNESFSAGLDDKIIDTTDDSRIPKHLLERRKVGKARIAGEIKENIPNKYLHQKLDELVRTGTIDTTEVPQSYDLGDLFETLESHIQSTIGVVATSDRRHGIDKQQCLRNLETVKNSVDIEDNESAEFERVRSQAVQALAESAIRQLITGDTFDIGPIENQFERDIRYEDIVVRMSALLLKGDIGLTKNTAQLLQDRIDYLGDHLIKGERGLDGLVDIDFINTDKDAVGLELIRSEVEGLHEKEEKRDPFGVLGVIELDTENVCNLHAVAIRKLALDNLSRHFEEEHPKQASFEMNRDHNETLVINAESSAVVSTRFATYGNLSLDAWTDAPQPRIKKRKLLKDKVLPNQRIDIEDQTVTFGVIVNTSAGRKVRLPLLKSTETSTGCNVLYANGEEIFEDSHNREEVLDSLRDLFNKSQNDNVSQENIISSFVTTVANTDPVSSDTREYIQMIQDQLTSFERLRLTDQDKLRELARNLEKEKGFVHSYHDESGRLVRAQVLDVRTHEAQLSQLSNADKEPLKVIITRGKNVINPQNGRIESRFIVNFSLEGDEYGKIARTIPTLSINIDEFGEPSLHNILSKINPSVADQEQLSRLIEIFSSEN